MVLYLASLGRENLLIHNYIVRSYPPILQYWNVTQNGGVSHLPIMSIRGERYPNYDYHRPKITEHQLSFEITTKGRYEISRTISQYLHDVGTPLSCASPSLFPGLHAGLIF